MKRAQEFPKQIEDSSQHENKAKARKAIAGLIAASSLFLAGCGDKDPIQATPTESVPPAASSSTNPTEQENQLKQVELDQSLMSYPNTLKYDEDKPITSYTADELEYRAGNWLLDTDKGEAYAEGPFIASAYYGINIIRVLNEYDENTYDIDHLLEQIDVTNFTDSHDSEIATTVREFTRNAYFDLKDYNEGEVGIHVCPTASNEDTFFYTDCSPSDGEEYWGQAAAPSGLFLGPIEDQTLEAVDKAAEVRLTISAAEMDQYDDPSTWKHAHLKLSNSTVRFNDNNELIIVDKK